MGHAAGSLYWHICNSESALALDPATMEFSYLREPAMMWDIPEHNAHKYRIGEMPEDGQLCVASLERTGLRICVRSKGAGSDHGWALERHVRMREALDQVPGLPKEIFERHYCLYLSDIDAGGTGKVFVSTFGYGFYSYHMNKGKLERLAMEDGQENGHPMFAFFSAPDGCSD